jgi:hypothetical protein
MTDAAAEPMAGCVLFLLQASESMPRSRLGLALLQIDQVIDLLLRRFAPTIEEASKIKVGVLGCSIDPKERKVHFIPLLPGKSRTSDLVPLSELVREEDRQLRLNLIKPAGIVRPAAGLHHAYLLLHHWLAAHQHARPPLVLHWSDATRCNSAHARISRSLRMLGSSAGAAGLAHVILTDEDRQFLGDPDSKLSRAMKRLWRNSSPVMLKKPGRALAINSDPLPLVRALLKQARPVTVQEPGKVHVTMRGLTMPKRGNSEEEIEDAFAVDEQHAFAAVSDGASEGIFVRRWAQLLTRSYIERRIDPADTVKRLAWISACRKVWLEQIDFPRLRWSQQNKVDETGGAATFLSWQLGHAPDGGLAWKAWAVGDSCLFWIRRNKLRATFPVTHSRHFANAPWLLSTRSDIGEPAPLFAAGRCEKGDLFLLATDALSQYLLRAVERRKEPNWKKLESLDDRAWRDRIEGLRDRKKIVNDDSTLVAIRVQEA